jgi:cytosine/adenosine deaminase-related metal-dependent hydrolase
VGAPADFVAVCLGSVRLAGTRSVDALDAVVFAANAADVSDVVVDGRVIVRGGAHVTLDVAGELRDAITAVSD